MRVILDKADRLWKIPQSSLGDMKFAQKRLLSRGVKIIDLDRLPEEQFIPEPLADELNKIKFSPGDSADSLYGSLISEILANHRSLKGLDIDPESEICITPGNRIASALLMLGILNPGECAYYPDPGAPYFRTAICLADGTPKKYGLLESSDYILNIAGLKALFNKKSKAVFLNYPHVPAGTSVDYYFYRELLKSLRFSNVLIVSDSAFIHPGNPDPAGLLQVKNAKSMAVELHSFAPTFGITGLGFAVGHKTAISILKGLMEADGLSVSQNGMRVALGCLHYSEEIFQSRMEAFGNRRDVLSDGLKKFGWHVQSGRMTPFIWARPPIRGTSLAIARRLFVKAGIKVTPGSDFGENGEGWIRITLAGDDSIMAEVVERMSQHSRIWQRKYKPE